MGVKFNPFTSKLDIVDSPSGEFSDIELALGTQTAPSLSFTGDPNTGIYSPGADQLAISTGGTGRLFVDANGKLGLGISSPAGALHVDAASGVDGPVFDSGGAANSNHALLVRDSANSQLLRVNNDGKVGIGTTSPQHGLSLLQGNALGWVSGAGNAKQKIEATGSDGLDFYTGGTPTLKATLDASGRLLVGTSSNLDSYNLQVDSSVTTVASFIRYTADGATVRIGSSRGTQGSRTALNVDDIAGAIRFDGYTGSGFSQLASIRTACDGQAPATGDSPGRLVFSTTADGASSPTERMRIKASGNVGIGTTSPEDKLEIGGAGAGIILASPDGTRYRLTVANGGTLSIAAV